MAVVKNNDVALNSIGESQGRPFKFFSLTGDGNVKYVRFLYNSMDDIIWAIVHDNITVNGRKRSVNCIKVPDNADSCPFCSAGIRQGKKAYLEMIVYECNGGQFTGVRDYSVWERGPRFMKELQSEVNRYVSYGTKLYEYVWEIQRINGATPKDTIYRVRKMDDSFQPLCPITPQDIPTQPFDPIKYGMLLNKTPEQMKVFLEVGEFPSAGGQGYMQSTPYMPQNSNFASVMPQQPPMSTPTYPQQMSTPAQGSIPYTPPMSGYPSGMPQSTNIQQEQGMFSQGIRRR